MTSEELIQQLGKTTDALIDVGDSIAWMVAEGHIIQAIRERDLMRDAIRLAKQRADAANPAHAWHYLVAALDLDTGSPLVDLSATTESSEE